LDVKVLPIRKDGSMAESMFSPPSRPFRASEKRLEWFVQSHSGAKNMTHVIPPASPDAGFHLQSSAPSPVTQPQAFDTIKLRWRFSDQFMTQGK
jgi:hypothetical protein